MANELDGKIIAFLVANEGVEEAELTEPWRAVEEAGGRPVLVASTPAPVQAVEGSEQAGTFDVEKTTPGLRVEDYDAVVLPGGETNAEHLRNDHLAIDFVRAMTEAGKPVAAICHGAAMLVEAGVVAGRTLTSTPSLESAIRDAGGQWVDQETCVSDGLVTSRRPDDLPAFCAALVEQFAQAPSRTPAMAGASGVGRGGETRAGIGGVLPEGEPGPGAQPAPGTIRLP